jgi:hypothetical protein
MRDEVREKRENIVLVPQVEYEAFGNTSYSFRLPSLVLKGALTQTRDDGQCGLADKYPGGKDASWGCSSVSISPSQSIALIP